MKYPVVLFENSRGEKVVESFLQKQSDEVLAEYFRLIDTLHPKKRLRLPSNA